MRRSTWTDSNCVALSSCLHLEHTIPTTGPSSDEHVARKKHTSRSEHHDRLYRDKRLLREKVVGLEKRLTPQKAKQRVQSYVTVPLPLRSSAPSNGEPQSMNIPTQVKASPIRVLDIVVKVRTWASWTISDSPEVVQVGCQLINQRWNQGVVWCQNR